MSDRTHHAGSGSGFRLVALVLSLILVGACSESPTAPRDPRPDPGITQVPSRFLIQGAAVGIEEGRTVECRLQVIVELAARSTAEPPFDWKYAGNHFGDVERIVETGEGGLPFSSPFGGSTIVRLARSGAIEIEMPRDPDAEGRFWEQLALLEGSVDRNGEGEGVWLCAPRDVATEEFEDGTVTVEVPWTLTPLG